MAVEMTQELPATGTAGDEGHCEVLQGADGPVYFLHQGLLFIVHDLLGRWAEPGEVHWLVSASVGRFGEPALYRLRCHYVDADGATAVSDGSDAAKSAAGAGAGMDEQAESYFAGSRGSRGRIGPADPYRRPGPGRWTVRRAANGPF
jgi:hypothetical protein